MPSRESYPGSSPVPAIQSPRRERLGRYVLFNVLGRGGMASVHLGRFVGEKGFERWVAVKRVHEHLLEDEQTRRMFLDEARTAAELLHPNLVQVTDFGEVAGQPYLVMEYINGETFSAIMRRCAGIGSLLPIPLATRIVAAACDGLHYAHELRDREGLPLGLVHRDVSPQNILISYDGGVKVTDFGIAKVARSVHQTKTGQMKGKTAYMSPEQVLSQPLDRRSDIFSMGIVLFEATLGRRLFKAESELETLQAITAAEVPPPRHLDPHYPPALEKVVLRALAKGPDDRYQTVREMQRDLERYLSQLGYPVGTAEVEELMERLFAEKKQARARMLSAAQTSDLVAEVDVELSPSTLSLPHGRAIPPTRRPRKGLFIAGAVVVLLACLVGGGWLLLGRSAAPEQHGSSPPSPEQLPVAVASADGGTTGAIERSAGEGDAATEASSAADAYSAVVPAADAPPAEAGAAPHDEREDGAPSKSGLDRAAPPRAPPGTISVMARPWCDVYLGSRRLGRTPLIQVQVPSGRRSLRFLPYGKQPAHRRVVTVRPGVDTPVSVNLTGGSGG